MRNWLLIGSVAVLAAACGGGEPAADPSAGGAAAAQSAALPPAASSSPMAIRLPGKRSDYTVAVGSTGEVSVRANGTGPASTYAGLARIHFSDTSLAFDLQAAAGQAYRLYKAAFDRLPDAVGLGYQIAALETQGLTLQQVAHNFSSSPEYLQRYGNTGNTEFVTLLYRNALHREPDAAGLAYHVGYLNAGTKSRAELLGNFSESPENQAQVLAAIQNGIAYTPWHAAGPDARNGSYVMYTTDAQQYTLTVDFDARSYRITGTNLDSAGTIASEGGEYVFQPAGAIAGFNNARFTYSNDTLVGGYRFASGVLPFVAARSFVDTIAEAAGTYNFLTTQVDPPAAPNNAIFTGEITTAGQMRTCWNLTIYKISLCPADTVINGTLTVSGDEFRASTSGGAYTFRVARTGKDRVILRAGPSLGTSRQFWVGTMESASFTAGIFTGVTNRGERISTTINGTLYSSAALSQTGTLTSRSGNAWPMGQGGAVSPTGMTSMTTAAGEYLFAIRGSSLAVVVGSRGSTLLPGYVEIGRP